MKKIVAIFLVFMMAAMFAACKDDNDTPTAPGLLLTDVPSLSSTPAQPSVDTSSMQAVTNPNGGVAHTMILTTQRGQSMPTVVTTNFVPESQGSTAPNFNLTIPSQMTAPYVQTSRAKTTRKVTTTKATTTKATTEEPTDPPTEKPKPGPKAISTESVGTLSNRQFEIIFSPDGWGGGVKSKSGSVSVVDSSGETKSVPARVAGKDADGNYRIVIDTSSCEEGDIRFTIPSQFVESRDGLSYNSPYSASANISWSE